MTTSSRSEGRGEGASEAASRAGGGSALRLRLRTGRAFHSERLLQMLARAAESVGMAGVHPHLLRHATGFKLVNQGVNTRTLAAYLGHRQIANTARYTKMDARRSTVSGRIDG